MITERLENEPRFFFLSLVAHEFAAVALFLQHLTTAIIPLNTEIVHLIKFVLQVGREFET